MSPCLVVPDGVNVLRKGVKSYCTFCISALERFYSVYRMLITVDIVTQHSFHDPSPLARPLSARPQNALVRGVKITLHGCELMLDHPVFCIGMVLVCLEGPYFILRSLAEAQMTTLTRAPPPRPTPLHGVYRMICSSVRLLGCLWYGMVPRSGVPHPFPSEHVRFSADNQISNLKSVRSEEVIKAAVRFRDARGPGSDEL